MTRTCKRCGVVAHPDETRCWRGCDVGFHEASGNVADSAQTQLPGSMASIEYWREAYAKNIERFGSGMGSTGIAPPTTNPGVIAKHPVAIFEAEPTITSSTAIQLLGEQAEKRHLDGPFMSQQEQCRVYSDWGLQLVHDLRATGATEATCDLARDAIDVAVQLLRLAESTKTK